MEGLDKLVAYALEAVNKIEFGNCDVADAESDCFVVTALDACVERGGQDYAKLSSGIAIQTGNGIFGYPGLSKTLVSYRIEKSTAC